MNQLDSRPHPAGILPAAPRAPQPLAQNGARRHQPAVGFAQAAGEGADLVGGPHTQGNEAGEKVGGDRQARAAGNVIHLADDFDAVARPANQVGQDVAERLGGAFQSRRHNSRGYHRRLEQPQVIVRKIENLGNRAQFGARLKVHTHQAQDGLVDDAEPCFHGRLGGALTAHGKVDGDVQHARPFREIHAQEENIAPPAVAQVHTHRRGLTQDGEGISGVSRVRSSGRMRSGASSGWAARNIH